MPYPILLGKKENLGDIAELFIIVLFVYSKLK